MKRFYTIYMKKKLKKKERIREIGKARTEESLKRRKRQRKRRIE